MIENHISSLNFIYFTYIMGTFHFKSLNVCFLTSLSFTFLPVIKLVSVVCKFHFGIIFSKHFC